MPRKIKDKDTGELREGNNLFYQFYKHNFKTIRKLMTESPLGARLFFFLIETMDNKNAIIVSQTALEEVLEVSRMSIYTATKYLIENNYIKVLKSGTSNVYCVNADIVWTQRADQKAHAKFEAKVYLTSSEQSENPSFVTKTEYQKVANIEPRSKDLKDIA